ncbi:sirohydrochlorin chelatase [Mycobacterium sp. MYCO198283]|uniref:sirohydrochlorin chelatase n=1 Tax=Mycobacterium sp. MYCO198283 TaxID=2883505 RepID=UPI001E2EF5E1|nr:CbiX/SirB N-terminal domain-containing protein [Mycobacterium sp. MYCO198283]MCG5431569.1 sirohydrochlorin chelatase [Mycobacterium sp. MYCO198283]
MTAAPLLVAHGTRSAVGVAAVGALADAVSAHIGPVRTAFVDVLGPSPSEVLATVDGPAVVVPAFLAAGYHVHTDLPAHVARSGHPAVTVTAPLGPDPVLADVMAARLADAGRRPGDAVVLAAAGSSDPRARRDVAAAADLLARRVGPVAVGYVATGKPRVADVVAGLRREHDRVFVASYLLAPGLFHDRLASCGATGVAAPLAGHPRLVELVVSRFTRVPAVR